MTMEKLKQELQNSKPIFGFERALKNIKQGKTKTVFLSSNCPREFKERIKLYGVEIIELKEESDEVALVCKRPHSISVVSF